MQGTLELLSQALSNESSSHSETNYKHTILERIRTFALSNLDDPTLSPRALADHFQISTRYLHALFKMTDETVGSWLKKERLRRCLEMLQRPAGRHHTITEIAQEWGFQDMSHFSKSFRQVYGMSPREARQQ